MTDAKASKRHESLKLQALNKLRSTRIVIAHRLRDHQQIKDSIVVAFAHSQQVPQHQTLGPRVSEQLNTADPQRFRRIAARGLLCGFVELDGVVSSYYAKALALQIVRRIPEVTDIVDRIRVSPDVANRFFPNRDR